MCLRHSHFLNPGICLIFSVTLLLGPLRCQGAATQRPNVVLIVVDDLGYNDVGYHGGEFATPNIDKLATSGVRLENYYVQPVCSPTRSAILSGRYPIHTGLQHMVIFAGMPNGLPLKFPTLADQMRAQGYSTHALGKWHMGLYKKEFTPLYRGFDSFFGFLNGREDHFSHYLCQKDNHTWCGYDLRDNLDPLMMGDKTYSTHLYTRQATKVFERSAQSQKPFFMYLAYQAPHEPVQAPEEYVKPYNHIKDVKRRIYGGMVAAIDEGLGNLTRSLQETGQWNNTIIIFTTDNGGQVHQGGNNFPLRGYKTTLWEGGIRGVGFVAGPPLQARRGQVSRELMHASDWFPTVAAMAGSKVNTTSGLDGRNQWPMIFKGHESARSFVLHNIDPLVPPVGQLIYHNTWDHRVRAAVRAGDYKLITGDPGDDRWIPPPSMADTALLDAMKPESSQPRSSQKNLWLFDIARDPSEVFDLSQQMPDKVREMLGYLVIYNSTAVAPRYPDPDPRCDPKLHGGFWGPWE